MMSAWRAFSILLAIILAQQTVHTKTIKINNIIAGAIGVCYGTLGDNLPSPADVVSLYKTYKISKTRIYNPNPEIQSELQSSGITVALGVKNEDLANLAGSLNAALGWVNTNIIPYKGTTYQYVIVGNEAIPGESAKYIAPAMQNLRDALNSCDLNQVIVTTSVASEVLRTSYPPSQGAFSEEVLGDMTAIISFLTNSGMQPVLMINVYPYFAYAADPDDIPLAYAQFFNTFPQFKDGDLEYWNLFDSMVDAFYSAMEKIGGTNIGVAVSESGWPSAGNGDFTTTDLAQRYNFNFMTHIANSGTPKRPNELIDGFLFAMFNEDQKPVGVEQNFGLFYPNGLPVYPLF